VGWGGEGPVPQLIEIGVKQASWQINVPKKKGLEGDNMEDKLNRKDFLKYLLTLAGFGVVSIFSFRKGEGFKIGKLKGSFGMSEANGTCGAGMGCAGTGGGQGFGQCGAGMGCAGGGGGQGYGQCGAGMGCAGGGGGRGN
jgi:hypothetical protein